MINSLIEQTLSTLTVEGEVVPVRFLYYHGHEKNYIIYMKQDIDSSITCDDTLQGYVVYYDFDIYSKGNISNIFSALRGKLESVGFIWQPSKDSIDMYEQDTGYYHRTVNFGYFLQED